jgi:hypothetical protein
MEQAKIFCPIHNWGATPPKNTRKIAACQTPRRAEPLQYAARQVWNFFRLIYVENVG